MERVGRARGVGRRGVRVYVEEGDCAEDEDADASDREGGISAMFEDYVLPLPPLVLADFGLYEGACSRSDKHHGSCGRDGVVAGAANEVNLKGESGSFGSLFVVGSRSSLYSLCLLCNEHRGVRVFAG
ncbi:hypothetical protein SUGI_0819330 [Cryptomeria japonica]|nr:hypothetical protein SUGI_0819330 [Cryptomeria japonica]